MNAKTTDRFMGSVIDLPGTPYRIAKLDDINWAIVRDWIIPAVNEKTGKPNATAGEQRSENLSYHPTLGKACKYLAGHLADEGEAGSEDLIDTLETYANRLRRIGQEIEDAVNEYTGEGKARVAV